MTRRQWCVSLAALVTPGFPESTASALLTLLPALQHLPDGLFCERSMLHVATRSLATEGEQRQAVPPFAEIVRALNDFRRTFVPDPTLGRLAPPWTPDSAPPTSEQLQAISRTLRANEAHLSRLREEREGPAAPASPMPDVTLKGEHLARLRAARGVTPLQPPPRRNGSSQPHQELPWP